MRPAVTVIPESFSPSRLLLPMGSTLVLERQPVWVRWHALLTAPASGQATQGHELARAQRATEAIFADKCRVLCLVGEGRADVAAHEITRALMHENLLPRDPEGDFSDGRRLAAVVAVDRAGRWSVARVGRAAASIAVVFQAPSQPAGVLWLDEPGEAVELPGAAEPQAFVAFERRERSSEEELRAAFEALVERVRELLVPPGALGGLRLPIVALGQGLPLLESRLLETNEALAGLMVESQQALGVVNETVRPLVSELRGAVEESAGAFATIERARKVLEEASEDARQQRAALLTEVAGVGERWARITEGLEEHRLRVAQGMDGQLALVGQAAAQLAETAGRVSELGSSLDGSLLVLRDTAGEVVEALERKATGIEALLLQTESLEQAVHSAVDSVSATDGQLREQAKGLVEFRKTVSEFVRRLGDEVARVETLAGTAARMESLATGVEALRASLARTLVHVDESAVGLLDSLRAKTRLFEGYLADSQALAGNLARAVTSAAETEQSLRGRGEALEATQKQLAAAAAGLAAEVDAARESAGAWKKLVDDAGGGVRAHLDEHRRVRAQLGKLDESAQVTLLSLEETEKQLAHLRTQVDGGSAAVAQITAGVEPQVIKLKQSVEEAGRLSGVTAEISLAAEALAAELRTMRGQSGAWKGLIEEARAAAKSHLDGYQQVRTSLGKLDEASQVGTLGIEELQGSLEALGRKLAGGGEALDSLAAGVAPSIEKLQRAAGEVADFSRAAAEATRSVDAARTKAPELEKAIAGFSATMTALADRAHGDRAATDEARGKLARAIEDLELAAGELLSGDRGVTALVEGTDKARAGLVASTGHLDQVVEGLRKREQAVGELAAASTLPASEARIADAAGRLEQLFEDHRGPVEKCRRELAQIAGQLKAAGERVEASSQEVDDARGGLTQSVERLNQRLEELRGFDPQAMITPETPSWNRSLPLYAGLWVTSLVIATGVILYRMPSASVVPVADRPQQAVVATLPAAGAASAAPAAAPDPAPTPAPAKPVPAPAPVAPAPAAAPPAPAAAIAADKQRFAQALRSEIEAGTITFDERGGTLRLVLPEEALFTPTTAKVTPVGKKALDALVRELKAMPPRGVMVSAFTDKTARSSADKDMALTLDRAWHVGDYMGSQGIDKSLIGAAGYGELEPLFDNADQAVRARNRRVEITFLAPAPPSAAAAPPAGAATPAPARAPAGVPAASPKPAAGTPEPVRAPAPAAATAPATAPPATPPPAHDNKKLQLDPE